MSTPPDSSASSTPEADLDVPPSGEVAGAVEPRESRLPFADPVGDLLLQGVGDATVNDSDDESPEVEVAESPSAPPASPQPEAAAPPAATAAFPGQLLAAGTSFQGTLAFDGRLVVAGNVRGDVVGDDVLELGETGEIEGNLDVAVAIIAGAVTGAVNASRAIELKCTARVKGDLAAPSLTIDKGALFDGRCRMDPRAAVPAQGGNEGEKQT